MTLRESIAAARLSGPQRAVEGTVVWEFQFGADDPVFAGHFPRRPLMPGIFQLEMARAGAEWAMDCPLAIREVRRARFQRAILPGEIVRLELKCSESGGAIRARAGFSVGGQRAGETTLILWRTE